MTPQKVNGKYEAANYYAYFELIPAVTYEYSAYTIKGATGSESEEGGTVSETSEDVYPYQTELPKGSIAVSKPGYTFDG